MSKYLVVLLALLSGCAVYGPYRPIAMRPHRYYYGYHHYWR